MESYQKSTESLKKQQEYPYELLKKGINIGTKVAGIGAFTRALPFLSELIPENFAMKGLNKINPGLGQFVKKTMQEGFDFDEVRDFVKDKIGDMQTKPKGIFEQILGDVDVSSLPQSQQQQLGFLEMTAKELEKKGIGPNEEPFKKLAKKVKDVLSGKTKILEAEAMGSKELNQQGLQSMQQPQMNQPAGQSSQGVGPGQKALMAILQKIQQSRGNP